jgi:hydrogenase 3 maturation protease
LKADLKRSARNTQPHIALLGIGNELNGDDAAGVWIARRLFSLLAEIPNLLILDCGTVPENAIGRLRRFEPEFVLLVDAADIGRNPGEVQYINPRDTSGFSASSHSLPFAVLANYIEKEFTCPVGMLGIQPGSLEFDAGLSSAVKNSVALIIKVMVEILRPSS